MALRKCLGLSNLYSQLLATRSLHLLRSSNVLCKVFVWKPAFTYSDEVRSTFFLGHQNIHTNQPGDVVHNKSEPVKSFEHGMDTDDTGRQKIKRKKLKGKRAVVRWLKLFRWKKKKEYERMTSEEKILYKLKKARRKEGRLLEALKKIEPPNTLETTHDPEILTPEEHFYYIKKAHKLKNYVPIGVRGISQGVILNMHLHWKKHETVKIIIKTFSPEEVKELAAELARLSGGIVLDIHEENTIIMYRGKNYSQPPTEIMSPKIALSRRKALDKAKIRDGLRAVRKYVPRLEQELELHNLRPSNNKEIIKSEPSNSQQLDASVDKYKELSDQSLENSELLQKLLDKDGGASEDESSEEADLISDSESLSDIFETDSEGEEKEKAEHPLYLDAIEKFPVEDDGGPEDFEEHLRQISSNSKKGKPSEKDIDPADLDEVDELFLRAGALLGKRGNKEISKLLKMPHKRFSMFHTVGSVRMEELRSILDCSLLTMRQQLYDRPVEVPQYMNNGIRRSSLREESNLIRLVCILRRVKQNHDVAGLKAVKPASDNEGSCRTLATSVIT